MSDYETLHVVVCLPDQVQRNEQFESQVICLLKDNSKGQLTWTWKQAIKDALIGVFWLAVSTFLSMYGGYGDYKGILDGFDAETDTWYIVFWMYGIGLISWYMNWYALDCFFYFSFGRRHEIRYLRKWQDPNVTIQFCSAGDCKAVVNSIYGQGELSLSTTAILAQNE
eukprot:CAMPEP_0114546222 /NCGR_PEP_ID=MMETSP0114-20121206/3820_1 /TAXON_ID=31324 /ORGANISM="Goniomonas sp, Strain m" /LENGTH=167 /DNA_ID=CAMNT_0001730705 /DNA_START=145 /DNA_END=645 /DNA_ORIENTATION=+